MGRTSKTSGSPPVTSKAVAEQRAATRAGVEALEREQQALADNSSLRAGHWGVIVASLLLTLFAFETARQSQLEKAQLKFEREKQAVLAQISERMSKYEDALWSGVAFVKSRPDVTGAAWAQYANELRLGEKYPGINGIGMQHHVPLDEVDAYLASMRQERPDFHIHPAHSTPDRWPISFIEPVATNDKAVGLDMAHETNRYTAATDAMVSGRARITGPIVLVQDAGNTPGFLFYAPFKRSNATHTWGKEGLVYAPFVVHKLMKGTLDAKKRHVNIRIRDGDFVMFDELTGAPSPEAGRNTHFATESIDMYGRTWTIDVESNSSFRSSTQSNQPTVILAAGLLIDLLLFGFFIGLSRANKNALRFADRVTATVKERTEELESINEDLRRFAYVVSHDLKAPIRGVGDLTEYLYEDLADHLNSDACHEEVPLHLERLQQQVQRMEALIDGVMRYSTVDHQPVTRLWLNVPEVLETFRRDLGLKPEQLTFDGAVPDVFVNVVQFEQVLQNLVSNAAKYHHAPDAARIGVDVDDDGERYVVRVSDDGPGIDPKYHERIFGVFQTLNEGDVPSTGIGLSIVQKIVERHGGTVAVESDGVSGTTFTFDWRKEKEER